MIAHPDDGLDVDPMAHDHLIAEINDNRVAEGNKVT